MNSESPHSRACGALRHEHGSYCHSNCPTCHGVALESQPPTTPDRADLRERIVKAVSMTPMQTSRYSPVPLQYVVTPETLTRITDRVFALITPVVAPDRDSMMLSLHERGAFCGLCDYENAVYNEHTDEGEVDWRCADCERTLGGYADAVLALVTPPTPADRAGASGHEHTWTTNPLIVDHWCLGCGIRKSALATVQPTEGIITPGGSPIGTYTKKGVQS